MRAHIFYVIWGVSNYNIKLGLKTSVPLNILCALSFMTVVGVYSLKIRCSTLRLVSPTYTSFDMIARELSTLFNVDSDDELRRIDTFGKSTFWLRCFEWDQDRLWSAKSNMTFYQVFFISNMYVVL